MADTAWPGEVSRPRALVPELMDDPGLAAAEHVAALRALARLNAASGAGAAMWRGVRPYARAAAERGRPLRVLDVACGGGDVVVGMARRARLSGAGAAWTGCDRSPTALERAREGAERAGEAAEFVHADVLRALPAGEWDVVTSSLFLHHLGEAEAVALLERLRGAARVAVVVSDLRRCGRGVALAWAASRAATRSRVVHVDAVLSARQAWTIEEARALGQRAGMAGARVRAQWPLRWMLTWEAA